MIGGTVFRLFFVVVVTPDGGFAIVPITFVIVEDLKLSKGVSTHYYGHSKGRTYHAKRKMPELTVNVYALMLENSFRNSLISPSLILTR